jgi:coenzyme F420 hydrogenase subunit beta
MNKNNIYRDYCSGCGLCHMDKNVQFSMDNDGFLKPDFENMNLPLENFLFKMCPVGGNYNKRLDSNHIWGKALMVYLGYSNDDELRHRASSGGILSAVCVYLLESGKVNGIIQTLASEECALISKTVCNTTKEQIYGSCGSRYCSSSPLYNLLELVKPGEKYAIVAKPCDIQTLRNWLDDNPEKKCYFPYLLSFFCMGVPSYNANVELVNELGCSVKNLCSINYRGNGWPGYTIVTDKDGNVRKTEYGYSWGTVLGRDLRKICKFCLDGLGEGADISCGDAWYITSDNQPDFSEHDGRNVIFARTDIGAQVLDGASKKGYITLTDYNNYEDNLKIIQKSQYDRRSSMISRYIAMRFLMQNVAKMKLKHLFKYAKHTDFNRLFHVFGGTVKRILKRSI